MTEASRSYRPVRCQADLFFPRIDVLRAAHPRQAHPAAEPQLRHQLRAALVTADQPVLRRRAGTTPCPYTVYTTGITWRKDHVPAATIRPRWAGRHPGREVQGQGGGASTTTARVSAWVCSRTGSTTLNTSDPAQINKAKNSLIQLGNLVDVHVDLNDYTNVPSGQIWIHQAFSGDMAAAASYMPKGTSVDVIGYWFPPDRPRTGRQRHRGDPHGRPQNPVLAHLFLNYLLDLRTPRSRTSVTSVTCSRSRA